MMVSRHSCQPTAEGCLRCSAHTLASTTRTRTALLLVPADHNVQATLVQSLQQEKFTFEESGPYLLLPQIAPRSADLHKALVQTLTPVTLTSTKGLFVTETPVLEDVLHDAFFHAEPLDTLLERAQHEWVRHALAEDWLFSMFQPIVTADEGETFAFEMLLRGRHPYTKEIIGAGAIIHACERLKLQHILDQRARQVAIRHAACLDHPTARYFINFMPNTIYDPAICLRTTMETVEECGMDKSRLVFEVVETEDIPDMKRLRVILDYYRSRGVQTAVDDLGAGFSSLHYLINLEPDFAKIDRDIVVQSVTDSHARRQLDQIIETAHNLNIRVIAEGIETPEQMRVAREAGADLFQGYLFARPAVPPQPVNQAAWKEWRLAS